MGGYLKQTDLYLYLPKSSSGVGKASTPRAQSALAPASKMMKNDVSLLVLLLE